MKIPRLLVRLRAFFLGYFWAPCPVCGRYFAGYEAGGGVYWTSPGSGKMTCPQCPGEHNIAGAVCHDPNCQYMAEFGGCSNWTPEIKAQHKRKNSPQ